MATKCLTPIKGRRIRVTKLDDCARPVFGDASSAVSDGFTTIAFTANTTESDEINITNAAGDVCVYEPAETTLVGYGVEITFCNVDPDVFALITGQAVIEDANGDVVGFAVNTKVKLTSGFALEIWTGLAGANACTTPGAQGNYGYLVVPFLRGGIVGDFTIENNAVTFTISNANTREGNAWGVGPYSDVQMTALDAPGPLLTPVDPSDAFRVLQTNAAPPAAACGVRPLLDPSEEALTSIAGVVAGMVATFTPTPADIAAPAWYDFGDGTWAYLPSTALAATTHTYTASGTYTVKASTNGTWVTTTVVVP
jgi:hypothetical protein